MVVEPVRECSPKWAVDALKVLEGRWKLVILYHLFRSPVALRFSQLERAIPTVTQKMLIQRLREMEQSGLVQRTVYPQVPPKVEYSLTPWGRASHPVMRALVEWADLRDQTPKAKRQRAWKTDSSNND